MALEKINKANLFDLHSYIYIYKASNPIGSRAHTNKLPLALEPITHVSYTE